MIAEVEWRAVEHQHLATALIDAAVRIEHLDTAAIKQHMVARGCGAIASALMNDTQAMRAWKFDNTHSPRCAPGRRVQDSFAALQRVSQSPGRRSQTAQQTTSFNSH